jgi:hypothetical protein
LSPGCKAHSPEYEKEHVLSVSYEPGFRIGNFDLDDVGTFAAEALVMPDRFRGQVIELTGERLTFGEIAECLSKLSGVDVRVRFRTEEETKELRASGKLPLLERQLWAREVSFGYNLTALGKYGIKLGTLAEYLEQEKGRLLETLGVRG